MTDSISRAAHDTAATSLGTNSTERASQARELSILDAEAWRRQSPYSWIYGTWTICAVSVRGVRQYELWRFGNICARDTDPQTLRVIASCGGGAA